MTTQGEEMARVMAHLIREQATFGGSDTERLLSYIGWHGASGAALALAQDIPLFSRLMDEVRASMTPSQTR